MKLAGRIPGATVDVVRREAWWYARNRIVLPATFARIHEPGVHARLMKRLRLQVSRRRFPRWTGVIIDRIAAVGEQGLLERMEPLRDHGFLHGDFQTANILIDERDHRVRLLDWESYRSGPSFIDLVQYFGTRFTFAEIENACAPDDAQGKPGVHDQYAILLYGLLISWLLTMQPGWLTEARESHFLPTMDRLEQLARA